MRGSGIAVVTAGLLVTSFLTPATAAAPASVAGPGTSVGAQSPSAVLAKRKNKKPKAWAVVARVYLSGQPVRGAKVSLTTLNGRKLKVRKTTSHKTTRFGMVELVVTKKLPTYYRLKVTGGKLNGKKLKHATLYGIGKLDDPLIYINMSTTLLSRYQKMHPKMKVKNAANRVYKYLGFTPGGRRPVFTLAQTTHLTSSLHDPSKFYRLARKKGGVNKYLKRVAEKVKKGKHVKANLVPKVYYLPGFGTGSELFGHDPSHTTHRKATAAAAGSSLSRASGLAGDVFGLLGSAIQWGAGNAAQSGACAEAHAGIAQGLLGCNATQRQAQQIENSLNVLQTQVSDLTTTVNTLVKDFSQAEAAEVRTNAGVQALKNTQANVVTYLQTLAAQQPQPIATPAGIQYNSTGPQVGNLDTLCDAAYPDATALGANQACEDLGNVAIGNYSDSTSVVLCKANLPTCLVNFFGYFTGVNQSYAPSQLIIPATQNSLMYGGTALLSGQRQNLFNQALAAMVGGEASLLQAQMAWQSWYESWTTTGNVVYNCKQQEYTDLNPATVDPSNTKSGQGGNNDPSGTGYWGTTCEVATNANLMMSSSYYLAQNGARASLPNLYGPENQYSATTAGVVLDTVASQTSPPAYWAIPVDATGVTAATGSDTTYWPYFPYGPAPGSSEAPGYNQANNPMFLSSNLSGNPTAILNAFPNDMFAIPATESLVQVANDAHNTAPSQTVAETMTDAGFVGIGQPNIMWWTNLSVGLLSMTWQTKNSFPGTPGTPNSRATVSDGR